MLLLYFRDPAGASPGHEHVVSILIRLIAITICGGAGAALGWALTSAIGWTGAGGAIVATVIAVTVATLLWTCGVALTNALRARE